MRGSARIIVNPYFHVPILCGQIALQNESKTYDEERPLSYLSEPDATMDKTFSDKIAIVTGSTSGIGAAVAQRLAAGGARVVCVGRNQMALDDLKSTTAAVGHEPLAIAADVTDAVQIEGVVRRTIEAFGRIDVLVNAAGHISTGTIENTSPAAWDAMMNVNLRAVFQLTQLCMPQLIATKGNVVNISSVTGLRSFPGVLAYCVSKAGLDQLTRCAALEVASHGVRINAVNPGVVITEIHKRGGMSEEAYETFLEHSKTTHPLGRVGTPLEIAELVCFLASEKAGWITGATVSIDGGRALTCAR
jgi:NAD(P)-dependent dehydrogenase (short-subunit alcohol dehydrogenase family)